MDQKHIGRLNQLFEKMVTNNVTTSEKNELDALYGKFIDEGRSDSKNEGRYNHTRATSIRF